MKMKYICLRGGGGERTPEPPLDLPLRQMYWFFSMIFKNTTAMSYIFLMDSSFRFETINSWRSNVYIRGSQIIVSRYKLNNICFSEDLLCLSKRCRPWWNVTFYSISLQFYQTQIQLICWTEINLQLIIDYTVSHRYNTNFHPHLLWYTFILHECSCY